MAAFDIVTFSLKKDVEPEHFVELDSQTQLWAYVNLEGIMRRTVAKNSDGQWIVVQLFDNIDQCGTQYFSNNDPKIVAWSNCIDHQTLNWCSYTLL